MVRMLSGVHFGELCEDAGPAKTASSKTAKNMAIFLMNVKFSPLLAIPIVLARINSIPNVGCGGREYRFQLRDGG